MKHLENGSRKLHIVGKLPERMQTPQLDALELACKDCYYTPIRHEEFESAREDLAASPMSMVIMDAALMSDLISNHGFVPNKQTILCVLERENPELAECLEKLTELRYVIGAGTPQLFRASLASILEFQITGNMRGLLPRLFQVETLTSAKFELRHSNERSKVQDWVTEFFTERLNQFKEKLASGTSSYPKNLGDVVDELLMNAIWDAAPDRESSDRTVPIGLADHEIIEVECSCDGLNLVLSVSDVHGSFPLKAIAKPLRFALGFRDDAKVNEGPGGAGLGLLMALQRIAALSVEVERGRVTRAVALLRGDQPAREMQKRPRTVIFFQKD